MVINFIKKRLSNNKKQKTVKFKTLILVISDIEFIKKNLNTISENCQMLNNVNSGLEKTNYSLNLRNQLSELKSNLDLVSSLLNSTYISYKNEMFGKHFSVILHILRETNYENEFKDLFLLINMSIIFSEKINKLIKNLDIMLRELKYFKENDLKYFRDKDEIVDVSEESKTEKKKVKVA